jgi:hypothetical protein
MPYIEPGPNLAHDMSARFATGCGSSTESRLRSRTGIRWRSLC